MPFEGKSGLQVANHYGARDTGVSIGVERTTKSLNTLSIELTPTGLNDKFLPPFVLPQKAKILRAWLNVDNPITGVTAVSIGDGNNEAVNGITLAAADLAKAGVFDVAAKLKGTWAVGSATTEANVVGIAVTGTAVKGKPLGRASITIEYTYKVRDDSKWAPEADSFPTGYTPQPRA